jgi:hypothetical protein
MEIRQTGAELFHADGWTDGQTDMRDEELLVFATLRKRMLLAH